MSSSSSKFIENNKMSQIYKHQIFTDEEFKNFIYKQILEFKMADSVKDRVKLFLSDQNLQRWKAAFTHKSVTTNHKENYEYYEIIGDAFLAHALLSNLINIIPIEQQNPEYMTDLKRYWLSKDKLLEFAERGGFDRFLIKDNSVNFSTDELRKMKSDVIEGFYGAILVICSEVLNHKGMGEVYANRYATEHFRNTTDIVWGGLKSVANTKKEVLKGSITSLKEIYDSLSWGDVNYEQSRDGNLHISTIVENRKIYDEKDNPVNINIKVEGVGYTIADSRNNAAAKYLEILNKSNINKDTVSLFTDKTSIILREKLDLIVKKYNDQAKGRISYGNIRFLTAYKDRTSSYDGGKQTKVNLYIDQGFNTSNSIPIFLSEGVGMDINSAKEAAIANLKRV